MISDEVLAFLEGGKSLVVGTRDADLLPECGRALGLRGAPDRLHVSVFLPELVSPRTIANLRANGCVAIGVSHPPDHRSLQLKGKLQALAAASDAELAFVAAYVRQLAAALDLLGLPAQVVERINYLPCLRADVRVDEIYLQTPGPHAGSPLAGRAP